MTNSSEKETKKHFPKGKYRDGAGLCKVSAIKEIEAQGWSLNPRRYVGELETAIGRNANKLMDRVR